MWGERTSGSGLIDADDGLGHAHGFGVGADVVDANDVGTALAGEAGEGDRGPESIFEVAAFESFGDHGFSGDTDEQGAVAEGEVGQVLHEGEVVLLILAKPEAGVESDALRVDALALELSESLGKVIADLADDVIVVRTLLHGLGRAGHVHDDETGLGSCGKAGHGGVATESGHVVEDVGSGIQRGTGDGGLHGIDGDEGLRLGTNGADDRDDATEFLRLIDGLGSGAGGLAADVEDVGPF